MIIRCFGCEIEKDTDVLETYPYPNDEHLSEKPIPPLLVLDCEGDGDEAGFRQTVVCHECFHKLLPDMWISKECWDKLNPKIPYEKLPPYQNNCFDPTMIKPLE